MVMVNQSLSIGHFPFYWRTKGSFDSNKSIETKMLGFELTYDPDFGFLKQRRSVELDEAIGSVYHLDHNIGYLQEGAEEFATYGAEYLDVIWAALDRTSQKRDQLKVVDIGCGGGLVLNEIAKRFPYSKRYGVDPSPLAKRASSQFGFELVNEFYPSKDREAVADVDLFLHYDVLEHVADPLQTLKYIFDDLNVGGLLVFSVPDCSKSIEHGDISMCIHEHLNYFSVTSLKRLVEGAGFTDVKVFKGEHGGTLFCIAEKGTSCLTHKRQKRSLDQSFEFSQFVERHERVCQKLSKFLNEKGDTTIGFYVPLRSIPYITKLNFSGKFKFYDDSRFFKHRFLDGFENNKIFCIDDLEAVPPEYTLIMTHAYGSLIKDKIEERSIDTRVVQINEFYE